MISISFAIIKIYCEHETKLPFSSEFFKDIDWNNRSVFEILLTTEYYFGSFFGVMDHLKKCQVW